VSTLTKVAGLVFGVALLVLLTGTIAADIVIGLASLLIG
jgi:hypothetical protein